MKYAKVDEKKDFNQDQQIAESLQISNDEIYKLKNLLDLCRQEIETEFFERLLYTYYDLRKIRKFLFKTPNILSFKQAINYPLF